MLLYTVQQCKVKHTSTLANHTHLCNTVAQATPFGSDHPLHTLCRVVMLRTSSCHHGRNFLWPMRSMLFEDCIHGHGVTVTCVADVRILYMLGWCRSYLFSWPSIRIHLRVLWHISGPYHTNPTPLPKRKLPCEILISCFHCCMSGVCREFYKSLSFSIRSR